MIGAELAKRMTMFLKGKTGEKKEGEDKSPPNEDDWNGISEENCDEAEQIAGRRHQHQCQAATQVLVEIVVSGIISIRHHLHHLHHYCQHHERKRPGDRVLPGGSHRSSQ